VLPSGAADRRAFPCHRKGHGCDRIPSLYLLFHIAPIFIELVLVAAVLWHYFDLTIAAVTFLVVIAYAGYTAGATQWRMKFRRTMNAQDREANARAIDSLLNYETVKYFGNEQHELDRFDEAKQEYVAAAIANQRSLSIFNIGQAAILAPASSRDADGGLWRRRTPHDNRRFRDGECLSAAALFAAQTCWAGCGGNCANR